MSAEAELGVWVAKPAESSHAHLLTALDAAAGALNGSQGAMTPIDIKGSSFKNK